MKQSASLDSLDLCVHFVLMSAQKERLRNELIVRIHPPELRCWSRENVEGSTKQKALIF